MSRCSRRFAPHCGGAGREAAAAGGTWAIHGGEPVGRISGAGVEPADLESNIECRAQVP
ncbi:hypothetical protein BSIN_3567 [Burkholderia singularis]|uniref:Uncharacterized protein n=1 Tax=Burkholderia singularis TaxID=1503053 RepID=A0A238H550_9BURK|nr:hypothetical protein BSIN_3567 [Burkholderia singularis]